MPQFKESQTGTNRSLSGFLSKQVRIHSFTPEINNNTQVKNTSTIPKISYLSITNFEVKKETNNNLPFSSIQPFLWNHTWTESGAARSRGVRTPLKITAGGNLLPSVVTASVTVKLLFLAPQDSLEWFCCHRIQGFCSMEAQIAWGFHPYWRSWIANSHGAAELQSRTDGTGSSSLPNLEEVAGPGLS